MQNRFSVWLPLLASFLLVGLFLLALFSQNPRRLPSVFVGKPLPPFSLPTLDGAPHGLTAQDFLGDEHAILNVWASWCAPCRAEHPHLMRLRRDGVAVFGLNYKDTPAAAKRFLKTLGNPYRKTGADRAGRVGVELGVYGVPESFVIDEKGMVLARHIGPLDEKIMAQHILPLLNKGGVR